MIIAFDTETYEYNKATGYYEPVLDARKFTIGCAKTDTGITKFFTNPQEMYEWLESKVDYAVKNKKRIFMYAHNAEYDWYAIARHKLMHKDLKYVIMGMPLICIWKHKGYVLDTMAFYRMALEDVGEILDFPKLELPKRIKDPMELKEYVERDVEITLQAMLRLKQQMSKLGYNPRKFLTAGQIAITAFWTYSKRTGVLKSFAQYNPETHLYNIWKTKYAQEIRDAFRGANTTAFKIGKFTDATQVDANGLYAHCMRTMRFPNLATEKKVTNPPVDELKSELGEIGVACVTVQAPNITLGYLPIRYADYQVFPTNKTMKGTWTFLELQQALRLGYEILHCHYYVRWHQSGINPFTKFIDELYAIEKKCETKMEKAPIKLIRNNLFGKFAQYRRYKEYDIIYRAEMSDKLLEGYTIRSSMGAQYVIEKEGDRYEPYYVNPIISCLITATARDFLYQHLIKIPHEDLLYCDTDGIIFKGNHLNAFTIGKELGEWKIEAQGDCKILGEKRYYIADRVKISGLPRREMSKDVIEREEDIQTKRMFGLKKGIKTGQWDMVGSFDPVTIEMLPHSKLALALPAHIDETGLSQLEDVERDE